MNIELTIPGKIDELLHVQSGGRGDAGVRGSLVG